MHSIADDSDLEQQDHLTIPSVKILPVPAPRAVLRRELLAIKVRILAICKEHHTAVLPCVPLLHASVMLIVPTLVT